MNRDTSQKNVFYILLHNTHKTLNLILQSKNKEMEVYFLLEVFFLIFFI